MDNIILITSPELQGLIEATLRKVLSEKPIITETPHSVSDYITRKETAKILGVSLPTLNEWTKNGIIPAYRISTRVRYKREDVIGALNKVQSIKYGRKINEIKGK